MTAPFTRAGGRLSGEDKMTRTRILLGGALALSLSPSALMAQDTPRPSDPQIADIAYTAGQIDVETAEQALKKTHNREVKNFAEEMVRDHTAVNKQALDLLQKLGMKPEPSDTSNSLREQAAKEREELAKLEGAAFDKAYAKNEVAFHQTINSVLEKTLIPDAQNSQLKNFLQTGPKLFQEHERKAEQLVHDTAAEPS